MCQSSSASPKRRQASSASTSSQEPGKRTTPNLIARHHLVVLDQRVGQQPLAHRRHLGRVLHVELDQPAHVHVATPSKPSAGSAPSTVWPTGSRIPSFGLISTRALKRALQPGREGLAGDALVGLDVERAGALDHVVRELRRGRRLVPAGGARPVAHVLLVEARLPAARLVAVGRPEARRVGRQDLVAEHDRAVGAAAELELGVGEDDPALARVLGAAPVDRDRQPAQLLQQLAVADDLGGAVEVDVLVVVAHLGLGRGREDRLRQLLGLAQPGRQLDPADRAGGLVVLPARAGDVAAHHALHRHHLEPLDQHRAAAVLLGHVRVRDQVVGADVGRPVEPEGGQAGEHLALVGDRRRVHHVVGGDAVGRDQSRRSSPAS